MSTIILFVGYPGAGKKTALEAAGEAGIPTLNRRDVVRRKFEHYHGHQPDEPALLAFEREQRDIHQPTIMGHWTARHLDERMGAPEKAAVAGLVAPEAVDTLREAVDGVVVVHIVADFEDRLRRLRTSEKHRTRAWADDDLQRLDDEADDYGMEETGRQAEYAILNRVMTRQFFKDEVKKLLARTTSEV